MLAAKDVRTMSEAVDDLAHDKRQIFRARAEEHSHEHCILFDCGGVQQGPRHVHDGLHERRVDSL
jgi:Fe2+ or Zn2+ uptake regulation protein